MNDATKFVEDTRAYRDFIEEFSKGAPVPPRFNEQGVAASVTEQGDLVLSQEGRIAADVALRLGEFLVKTFGEPKVAEPAPVVVVDGVELEAK